MSKKPKSDKKPDTKKAAVPDAGRVGAMGYRGGQPADVDRVAEGLLLAYCERLAATVPSAGGKGTTYDPDMAQRLFQAITAFVEGKI